MTATWAAVCGYSTLSLQSCFTQRNTCDTLAYQPRLICQKRAYGSAFALQVNRPILNLRNINRASPC